MFSANKGDQLHKDEDQRYKNKINNPNYIINDEDLMNDKGLCRFIYHGVALNSNFGLCIYTFIEF